MAWTEAVDWRSPCTRTPPNRSCKPLRYHRLDYYDCSSDLWMQKSKSFLSVRLLNFPLHRTLCAIGLKKLSDLVLIGKSMGSTRLLTYSFPSLSFASWKTLQKTKKKKKNSEEIKQHLTHNPHYYLPRVSFLMDSPKVPALLVCPGDRGSRGLLVLLGLPVGCNTGVRNRK